MPKPMTMTIDVEEVAFGKIFRTLDGMPGVVNIKITGSGPKAARAGSSGATSNSSQKRGGANTVPCIILNALMDAETPLGRPDLAPVLELHGKRATSLPDSLTKLRRENAIKSIGKGHNVKYRITAAGVKQFEKACSIQPMKE